MREIKQPQLIFLNHSDYIRYYKDLKMIGYWYNEYNPDFPEPHHFVDPTWNKNERQMVIDYLKNGKFYEGWKGSSYCRFCGEENGAVCLTDGVYVFPEGLAHYVEEHEVRLPEEFVEHVRMAVGK